VLLPKTLYVLSLPSPQEAAGSAPTLEQDPQKQQGEAEEWLVEYSAEILKGHLENGKKATVGFTSSEVGGTWIGCRARAGGKLFVDMTCWRWCYPCAGPC